MADRSITYFVVACCLHLVKMMRSFDIVSISATRSDTGMRGSRKIRQVQCEDIIDRYDNMFDLEAIFPLDATRSNAREKCLANMHCYGYVVKPNEVLYSQTSGRTLLDSYDDSTTFVIIFRCPMHNRCSRWPCNNGGSCRDLYAQSVGMECTCGDYWKGWYCETRIICQDDPCTNGGTCSDSATGGFICTCPVLTTGNRCEVQLTTASITVNSATVTALAVSEVKITTATNPVNTTNVTVLAVSGVQITTAITAVNTTTVTELALSGVQITTAITTVTERAVTASNKTVEESEESGLTSESKIVIGAAAAAGGVVVVVAVVATKVVISSASATAAGAK